MTKLRIPALTRRAVLGAASAAALAAALPVPALAATAEEARAFVESLRQAVFDNLIDVDVADEVRVARFRDLLTNSFDVPTIGRFVLGRYWNVATPEQRQEFLALFENMIVSLYARRFREYSGEDLQIGQARAVGTNDFLVSSAILRPNGPPVAVDWRVRPADGQMRILDVMVEGASLAVTQRQEYAAVIQQGGGRIEALLEALRRQQG